MTGIPVFVLLEVYGEFWCAPSWVHVDEDVDWYTEDIPTGFKTMEIIPEFSWPEVDGDASGLKFWGALVNKEFTDILGEYDIWEFGYN